MDIFSALLSTVNGPVNGNSSVSELQTSYPPGQFFQADDPCVVEPPQTSPILFRGVADPQWQQQQWRPKKPANQAGHWRSTKQASKPEPRPNGHGLPQIITRRVGKLAPRWSKTWRRLQQ